jgi:hypothetical protein
VSPAHGVIAATKPVVAEILDDHEQHDGGRCRSAPCTEAVAPGETGGQRSETDRQERQYDVWSVERIVGRAHCRSSASASEARQLWRRRIVMARTRASSVAKGRIEVSRRVSCSGSVRIFRAVHYFCTSFLCIGQRGIDHVPQQRLIVGELAGRLRHEDH